MTEYFTKWRKADPDGWKISDVGIEYLSEQICNSLKENKDKKNAVVFDLDGTLFDVNFRTFEILQRWFKSLDSAYLSRDIITKIAGLSFEHIGYSVKDSFEKLQLDFHDPLVENLYETTNKYWKKNFFSGESILCFDKPYPGAVYFAQNLHENGAHIIYISGRNKSSVEQSTIEQLQRHDFPMNQWKLVLKESHKLEDTVFKAEQLALLSKEYNIIANFENEYVNLAAMTEASLSCMHVIVDAPHSDKYIPQLKTPVYRISSFIRKNFAS